MKKNRPSRTAFKVAIGLLTLGTLPEMQAVLPAGLLNATSELLLKSGLSSERTLRWARSPKMLKVYRWFDPLLPGQFEAFAYRKRFCEQQVRQGISEGATQVLVLGAGYDTLGWRLAPEFPDVTFFEIDHPATANIKAKGVRAMGDRPNLHLIAEDLGQKRMTDVLSGHTAWDVKAKTVIIAEGLLMYLPDASVEDLFRQCATVTGQGSRIAFSYIPTDDHGKLDMGKWTNLMLWGQKKTGEPMLWGTKPEQLPQFLESVGWSVDTPLEYAEQKYGVEFYIVAKC